MHYFDAGVNHRPAAGVSLGLSAYAKYASDLNDFGQFGQALVYSPFNWTQAKIYGVEFTAQYKKNNLSAYFNAAVSRAQGHGISSGQFNFGRDELEYINTHWVYLDHDQRLTSSAGVSYNWSQLKFLADALFGTGMRSTPQSVKQYAQKVRRAEAVSVQIRVGLKRSKLSSNFAAV